MTAPNHESIAWLLERAGDEERGALTRAFPLIYEQLQAIARGYMAGQPASHTLAPTALVHEAFIRLKGAEVRSRESLLALAAVAMRHILVDHARERAAAKRDGGPRVSLADGDAATVGFDVELLDLHELLARLATLDPRRAHVVELRFFAGMTNEQIAAALGVARSTVAEDWSVARAWLAAQLGGRESA